MCKKYIVDGGKNPSTNVISRVHEIKLMNYKIKCKLETIYPESCV